MYISEFAAGVLGTLFVEFVALMAYGIYITRHKGRDDK